MTLGESVIAFVTKFCVTPEGVHVGKPIVLAEFQKDFIRATFDNPHGTRRAILSVGRKSGKSTLMAGIVLASLVGPLAKQNASLCVGAMSREQASLIFNAAAKMCQLSPTLSRLVKVFPSGKRMVGLPLNVEFKALAADGKTAMGGSYSLILIDEIGQIRGPKSDFVDSLVTSQGAYAEPLLIAISTRASNEADLFEQWIKDAETSQDPKIISHVYSAPEGCDLMDESAWYAANPALGLFRSMDDLREQLSQAKRMPSMENSARNLLLNQVISTDSPYVSPGVWKACSGPVLPFDGPVWAGLDLSARLDLTALVLVGQVEGVWQVQPHFWTPEQGLADRARRDRAPYDVWARQGLLRTTPGASVDYAFVAADMAELLADLDVRAVAFDRWRIDLLKKELDAIGCELPLEPFGQGFKGMAPALDSLEAELLNGRVAHGGNAVLTMCAANATVVKDPTGARKLDKSRATGRIDGLQALAMAMGVAAKATEAQGIGFDSFTFV